MDRQITEAIDRFCNLIEDLTAGTEFQCYDRKLIKTEIGRFIMFLVASDKVVTPADADLLNEYLLSSCPIEKIQEAISTDDVYVRRFFNEIPFSLEMFVTLDRMITRDGTAYIGKSPSEEVIELYRCIGAAVVSTENKVHYNDRKNLKKYIEVLEKYRSEKMQSALL